MLLLILHKDFSADGVDSNINRFKSETWTFTLRLQRKYPIRSCGIPLKMRAELIPSFLLLGA